MNSLNASAGMQSLSRLALVAAFEVVVAQKSVEVALDFGGCDVPRLPSVDAEALVQQRTVKDLMPWFEHASQ